MWERFRVGCYDWRDIFLTHISKPCFFFFFFFFFHRSLIQSRFSTRGPLAKVQTTRLVYSANCPPRLTAEVKNFCHHIIFGHPHFFPSGAIHVIDFHSPLFTLRQSCISCNMCECECVYVCMSSVQNVSRLKIYLPRWTYRDRNEHHRNVNFLQNSPP